MFKRLNIKGWRQFSDIDIVFHDHLTVLTGANGAVNLLKSQVLIQRKVIGRKRV